MSKNVKKEFANLYYLEANKCKASQDYEPIMSYYQKAETYKEILSLCKFCPLQICSTFMLCLENNCTPFPITEKEDLLNFLSESQLLNLEISYVSDRNCMHFREAFHVAYFKKNGKMFSCLFQKVNIVYFDSAICMISVLPALARRSGPWIP